MTTLTTASGSSALDARVAPATHVTAQGAAWLASASASPRTTLALWLARPGASAVLPCGTAFDVVNVPVVLGRRVLDLLWDEGPGCGPVAVHRGRLLLFATAGTAHRLPALLAWEEWGGSRTAPVPLCHGLGDAVTVPPLAAAAGPSRWLVAPGTRSPWLPGPEALLWAFVRAARAAGPTTDLGISIFPSADQDANVSDVSRRR
ncbi:bifunctional DNA primase/polymerase [Streptomyces sp. NPDC058701]|uniref:bifunctional DNA primase/polymerase n=1 Tax=Streptomyces sp. NPDC058701 TaxID=3346608 RepID=UPI00365E3D2E